MADRSYLVLDLETIPDPELFWDSARDGFPPSTHHRIVAIGVLWLDADLSFRRVGIFAEKTRSKHDPEAAMLDEFVRFVGREHCHLVTYNGRTFDLPVLINRCLRHGLSFGTYFTDRDYRYRYSDFGHVDLADVLAEHGASRSPKLETIAATIGIPGSGAVNGSMVASLHARGDFEAIRRGCLEDVVQTAFLFLRFELLRGRIDRDGYRARASELLEQVRQDERCGSALVGLDEARLTLAR